MNVDVTIQSINKIIHLKRAELAILSGACFFVLKVMALNCKPRYANKHGCAPNNLLYSQYCMYCLHAVFVNRQGFINVIGDPCINIARRDILIRIFLHIITN